MPTTLYKEDLTKVTKHKIPKIQNKIACRSTIHMCPTVSQNIQENVLYKKGERKNTEERMEGKKKKMERKRK